MSPWGRRQQGRCAPACGGAGPPRCPGGPRGEPPLTTTIRVSFMNFEGLEIFFQNLVFLVSNLDLLHKACILFSFIKVAVDIF